MGVPEEEGLPWLWIILGAIAGLLLIGAIIFMLQKKPKVKKTRAVKIEPKPAAPAAPPVYFMPAPQQTVPIPQPSVVQVPQYQPMTATVTPTMYTAPTTEYVTTVAAAPTTVTAAPITTAPMSTYATGGSVLLR